MCCWSHVGSRLQVACGVVTMRKARLLQSREAGFVQNGGRDGIGADRVVSQRTGRSNVVRRVVKRISPAGGSPARTGARLPATARRTWRLRSTGRLMRRLHARLRHGGYCRIVHRLPRRRSKISKSVARRVARHLSQACYAGFDPTLEAKRPARRAMPVCGEMPRRWMSAAWLGRQRRRCVKAAGDNEHGASLQANWR